MRFRRVQKAADLLGFLNDIPAPRCPLSSVGGSTTFTLSSSTPVSFSREEQAFIIIKDVPAQQEVTFSLSGHEKWCSYVVVHQSSNPSFASLPRARSWNG